MLCFPVLICSVVVVVAAVVVVVVVVVDVAVVVVVVVVIVVVANGSSKLLPGTITFNCQCLVCLLSGPRPERPIFAHLVLNNLIKKF